MVSKLGPLRLYTLDYTVRPEEMGDVHIYQLTPEFTGLWQQLAQKWDKRDGFKTPHGSLRVALTSTTGRMIIFTVRTDESADTPLARRSLIVSDGPLDEELTRICVNTWQALYFPGSKSDPRLSEFINVHDFEVHSLSKVVERDTAGYIIGPWWWKKAIGWPIAARLAPHPALDRTRPGKETNFSLTTEGTLVAWDYPWHRTTNAGKSNERRGYAMGYISIEGETQRGNKDPIVRFDCHVTRVASTWFNVKTVYLKHPRFATMLRVPVRSFTVKDTQGKEIKTEGGGKIWKTTFRGHTAEIVEACGLDPIALPEQADGNLDMVRAVFRNTGKHMIGKGAGAYFTLRIATHISRILGRTPRIYNVTPYNIPAKSITTGAIPLAKLPAGLASSGWASVRLVVLFARDSTPKRILRILETAYGVTLPLDLSRAGAIYDGAVVDLTSNISVVLCKSPEITMHGPHDRAGIIRDTPNLKSAGPDDLIAAICETEWAGKTILNDAKNPVRRDLAAQRIVSQFIVANDGLADGDRDDYPASAALRDVIKSCGIADNRLACVAGLTPGIPKEAPLTEPVTLVGIHFRRHLYRRVKGAPTKKSKLVAILTAVHLDPDPDSYPVIEMYAEGGWLRYAEAVTSFYAGEIGNPMWTKGTAGAQAVRDHVDAAMESLILPAGTNRVVVILDKAEAQNIYPAAGDNPSLPSPLPGRWLEEEGIDLAVARIALGAYAPRPATAFRDCDDLDTMEPSYRRTRLFVNDEGEDSSWLLTQASQQHQGAKSPQRIGTKMSREDFGEIAASHMGKDMHATSRVEIVIPKPGTWKPGDLAILIARLCDQALVWDNRTSRPAPLHLGYTADRDHPDYGNHDPGGEADDDQLDLDDE